MMHRQLFQLPIFLFAFTSCAQEDAVSPSPDVQRYVHRLGVTEIFIRKTSFDTANQWFFIQLHDDEHTAETAATAFLQQHGGTLLSFENSGERFIRFSLTNKKHTFDPNRIFSATGIRTNLQLFDSYSLAAAKAVARFRDFLLCLVPDTALVIAVHNNTEGRYSIYSYQQEKTLKQDAAAIHINPAHDSDDFFITTDNGLFKKLAQADYNCVLQKPNAAHDDGSLSFYYGRRGGRYVNVEAQTGHLQEQQQMLQALQEILLEE